MKRITKNTLLPNFSFIGNIGNNCYRFSKFIDESVDLRVTPYSDIESDFYFEHVTFTDYREITINLSEETTISEMIADVFVYPITEKLHTVVHQENYARRKKREAEKLLCRNIPSKTKKHISKKQSNVLLQKSKKRKAKKALTTKRGSRYSN